MPPLVRHAYYAQIAPVSDMRNAILRRANASRRGVGPWAQQA
jgi:hypothetical protein